MPKKTRSFPMAVVCTVLLTAGCDWLRPGGPPEKARIEVSSEDVDRATLVVSQTFVWGVDPECDGEQGCEAIPQPLGSDTMIVDLPHKTTVEFASNHQLFVATYPADDVAATLSMRVDIDGIEMYNGILPLDPPDDEGNRDALIYAYQFGGVRPGNDVPTGGG